MVFQLMRPRTSTCPNKICIIRSHTLAGLARKISAGSAHRGLSNRLRRRSTRGKNGEYHRFLTVFQLLCSRTSTHPNEIRIVCSHTLARKPRKISARSANRGPSNRPRSPSTRAKNSENQFLTDTPIEKHSRENFYFFFKKSNPALCPFIT